MTIPSPGQFPDFFRALHGHDPYSWQTRLARRAVEGDWPGAIDLPTGSGKTACVDVAVFALACQASRPVADRTAPRRIFFCVNRRVIVDEAHERARRIASRLSRAEEEGNPPVLRDVAAALRQVAGTARRGDLPPLDVLELRGGIHRDNRWARSAAQPTVVCATIDQLGSRLLFRGYGVSPSAAPIQAALVAYDSLVLLDEAHISEPFRQSLDHVRNYLDPEKWAERSIGARPLTFVPMTATPPPGVDPVDVIRLDDEDRKNESLLRRLEATKRAVLEPVADVAKAVVERSSELAESGRAAIGIIVNRVATAREVDRRLRERHPDAIVELVIGAMRPIDRDTQAKRLDELVGPKRPDVSEKTVFVVSTQCLEVGADYDFDVLVTECASLDALRQRFGRLNRRGRPIEARAVIVVREKDVKAADDPIYGGALSQTWSWLWDHADVGGPPEAAETSGGRSRGKAKAAAQTRAIDFGIEAFQRSWERLTEEERGKMLAPSAFLNAPVMLPAHVDSWCQTSPSPAPDPDVSLFIHGPRSHEPDIQVCWRADLIEGDDQKPQDWCDVVALLPPTAAECMSVPISRVRRWLASEGDDVPDLGDALEVAKPPAEEANRRDRPRSGSPGPRVGVLWRGFENSVPLTSSQGVRPGDTLVLPAEGKGWEVLGHVPETSPPDVAEAAFQAVRCRRVVRLHVGLLEPLRGYAGMGALLDRVADADGPPGRDELAVLLAQAAEGLPAEAAPLRETFERFAEGPFVSEPYPGRRGLVLTSRELLRGSSRIPALDDGDDDASRARRRENVELTVHTGHVVEALTQTLALVGGSVSREAYRVAADRHDWGKADERFQALLNRAGLTDAWLSAGRSRVLLAKSALKPRTPSEYHAALQRAGLPRGFRHEMLSAQLAERARLPLDTAERDLVLHLIASHHGHARPFAPVVDDRTPPDVVLGDVTLTSADRLERPPHRLDSGIADRFWSLTRRHGWWGLAYLEALLRLADQQASADEDAGPHDDEARNSTQPPEACS